MTRAHFGEILSERRTHRHCCVDADHIFFERDLYHGRLQLVAQASAPVQLSVASTLDPRQQPRRDLRDSVRCGDHRVEFGVAGRGDGCDGVTQGKRTRAPCRSRFVVGVVVPFVLIIAMPSKFISRQFPLRVQMAPYCLSSKTARASRCYKKTCVLWFLNCTFHL